MIIFISGLSSSGKTTIGRHVYELWKQQTKTVLLVDGDEVREVLSHDNPDTAFTVEARHKLAWRYAHLCKWLDRQDMHAVCCTISYFDDVRRFNRNELSKYFEVFHDVSMEALIRRDKKDIYARGLRGEMKNIVGLDLMLSPPTTPDLHIKNDADLDDPMHIAEQIFAEALSSMETSTR